MKNILITGPNGFIGRALCKRILADGYRVRGAVRTESQMAAVPSGVEGALVGDIGPETDWSEALGGIDGIVHLAARVHVMRESSADPLAAFRQVNVAGTERLARQAAEAGVKRLVYISSVKVNGEGRSDPYTETDRPDPYDPYAVSKWGAEQVLRDVAAYTGLEVVILRPPLVYGPGVKGNFLRLQRLIATGLQLPLASIKNQRSIIYVGNLVDAIITCLVHPKAAGETFLVSDGQDISTPELIRLMTEAMGRRARIFPFPPGMLKAIGNIICRSAEVERVVGSLCVDSGKIRAMLGWKPLFTVEEGMKRSF